MQISNVVGNCARIIEHKKLEVPGPPAASLPRIDESRVDPLGEALALHWWSADPLSYLGLGQCRTTPQRAYLGLSKPCNYVYLRSDASHAARWFIDGWFALMVGLH